MEDLFPAWCLYGIRSPESVARDSSCSAVSSGPDPSMNSKVERICWIWVVSVVFKPSLPIRITLSSANDAAIYSPEGTMPISASFAVRSYHVSLSVKYEIVSMSVSALTRTPLFSAD